MDFIEGVSVSVRVLICHAQLWKIQTNKKNKVKECLVIGISTLMIIALKLVRLKVLPNVVFKIN
jgi:hypothetical protein